MAYCTNANLTLITGTALSTAIQDEIIAVADAEINAFIYEAGLTPPGSDTILEAASLKLAQAGVMSRHRMDGTQPGSLRVGDVSSGDDIDSAIQELRNGARLLIDAYIRKAQAATRLSSRIYVVNG